MESAAAGDNSVGVRVTGDTASRFKFTSYGIHKWGPGSSTQDTQLYRTAQGQLSITDGGSSAQ